MTGLKGLLPNAFNLESGTDCLDFGSLSKKVSSRLSINNKIKFTCHRKGSPMESSCLPRKQVTPKQPTKSQDGEQRPRDGVNS